MEFYILDNTFLPVELLEGYQTVIWDERMYEPGQLEIQTAWTEKNKSRLRIGTYLGNSLTPRIMEITQVESVITEDNDRVLKIQGEGLERILGQRAVREDYIMLDDDPAWVFKNKKPAAVMRTIFNKICVEGVLSPKDVIPYISTPGNMPDMPYQPGNIQEPPVDMTIEIEPQSIADVYSSLTEHYPELGYRLYRNMWEGKKLYFEVYTGHNRTLTQATLPPVVFSLPWGSLDSTSELDSIAEYYNVAYVFGKYAAVKVNDNFEGLDRRVLILTVEDQEADNLRGTELKNYLTQKGQEALMEHRRIALFDGEIPSHISYQYMRDYFLGDEVDLVGDGRTGAVMRIIGNVIISDAEGLRSYPTFQMLDHIQPDTWSGLRGGEVWTQMPGTWTDY